MFRLADDTTTRKVIQVANSEGTQSFAMLQTMPVHRADAPSNPEIRFMETAAGAPMAVRAWWQQGERTGYGFIYSKEQLAALNRSTASAPATAAPIDESLESEVRLEDARGEPVVEAEEPLPEGPLSGPDVVDGPGAPPEEPVAEIARAQQPPASEPPPARQVQETTREELPQTASPFALWLLGGLASTSIGLKLLRKS
jgi:hypothetical protein